MKLIVLSPEEMLPLEQEIVKALFNEGLQYFHVRKPAYSKKEMKAYIAGLPVEYYSRISLHSHHILAEEYCLGGLHYNVQNQLPNAIHTNQKGLRMSTSIHTLIEVMEAKSFLNYVFLSPLFDSISKPSYKANADFSGLKEMRKIHYKSPKVIALGGITNENVEIAAELGFSGVAVLGYLWCGITQKQSIIETVKKYRALQAQCAKFPG